jgi:hypothetical protein
MHSKLILPAKLLGDLSTALAIALLFISIIALLGTARVFVELWPPHALL